jgi:L-alanine-DL-glutamate epimerase-like enolase superfamily enzyme
MKITDIRLTGPVYIPTRQCEDAINILPAVMSYSFCEISTDEGITGLTIGKSGSLYKALIEEMLKPYVIGEDRGSHERHKHY